MELPAFDFVEQGRRIERMVAEHPATSEFRRTIRDFVSLAAKKYELSDPVIDVGCGYRSSEPEVCGGRPATRYYTMDPGLGSGADFCWKVEDSPSSLNGIFGAAICTDVLEHVEAPADSLLHIGRLLRPGGHLVLTVPFWVPIHERRGNRDYWRFTPNGVASLLSAWDVKEIATAGDDARPTGVFAVAQRANRR